MTKKVNTLALGRESVRYYLPVELVNTICVSSDNDTMLHPFFLYIDRRLEFINVLGNTMRGDPFFKGLRNMVFKLVTSSFQHSGQYHYFVNSVILDDVSLLAYNAV